MHNDGSNHLIGRHRILPVVAGNTPQEDADEHRNPDRHKSDRERDPGSLHHPGKHVPPEVIGPEEIDAKARDRFGS